MNGLLRKSEIFLKRNSATILTVVGGVGVVVTAILAAKETPKALKSLENAEKEKGEKLTKIEIVKAAAPAYIPAAVAGVSTIACIFGANILNKRQQAALMSAYALLDASYKEYKDKVAELYGEEANENVISEIAKDKYDCEEFIDEDDGKELFFDQFSGRYFRATLYEVQQAEYRLNRTLIMQDYAYLNDFYEWLPLELEDYGFEYGWTRGHNFTNYWQEWVDFTHKKVKMDDGMECTIIIMQGEPILGFEDYA